MSAAQSRPETQVHLLDARQCTWLYLGYLTFVVYGSLVPFSYRRIPLTDAIVRFRAVLAQHDFQIHSKSDFLANVLFYVPLGFLLMAALCADRRWRWAWPMALLALPLCTFISMNMEFLQLFFPPRVTSFGDIYSNSIGGWLGVAIWLLAGLPILRWCRLVWTSQLGVGVAGLLLPGYLLILVVLSLMPPDLTISPVEIYHKYENGMIRIIPFEPHGEIWNRIVESAQHRFGPTRLKPVQLYKDIDGFYQIEHHLWNVAYFYPIGMLAALLKNSTWRRRSTWPRVAALGLLISGTIEFLQLFDMQRFFDMSDIVTGTLAIVSGWWSGIALAERLQAEPIRESMADQVSASQGWMAFWGIVWFGAVVFVNWHPFRFVETPAWPGTWMPFVDYYDQHNYFQPLDQFVRKTLLFLPGGILITLSLPAGPRSLQGLTVCSIAFVVAAIVEIGQLFVPSRYFSVTDILVETNGAWLGFLLTHHARLMMPMPAYDENEIIAKAHTPDAKN